MSEEGSLEIVLRGEVSATEDPDKVLVAARNVLGECAYTVERRPNSITLRSSGRGCLQRVHDQLRDRHVRDAARRLMLKSIEDDTMRLLLNRQAAFIGIIAAVSTGEESPLGPLELTIRTREPLAVLDWLTLYRAGEPERRARPSPQGTL